jgi:RNA polymerase sigma-70 factor (ECF subfamily)
MDRLRGGEDAAARDVFERYSRQLIGLARKRLDQGLGAKADPEDVVQSAYKSFFMRQRDGRLEVESWEGLWSLLVLITVRKCIDRVEYLRAARRDLTREMVAAEGGTEPWQLAIDREPQPEEAAILAETVEELFRAAEEDERPILQLSLQGFSVAEVSEQLGRAQRSVRRLRERVRKRLERMQVAP